MAKKAIYTDAENDIPDLLEMAAGRAYMKEIYSPSARAEAWQVKFWLQYLEGIALSRFEWHDLPAGIDARALELELYLYGVVGMFQADEYVGREGGFLMAQCSNMGALNMYYNPNRVLLVAPMAGDGQQTQWYRNAQAWVDDNGEIQPPNCALCWDSLSRRPLYPMLRNYARRLAEIDRIVQTNMGAQRTPYILAGGEGSSRTTKRLIQKLENNEQYIVVNGAGFDIATGIQVLNTESPYVAKDILSDQKTILNQALSLMGVDNDPQAEKKERRNSLEVLQNNEQVIMCRNNFMKAREMFCEACARVFGVRPYVTWAARHFTEDESASITQAENGSVSHDAELGGYE